MEDGVSKTHVGVFNQVCDHIFKDRDRNKIPLGISLSPFGWIGGRGVAKSAFVY